MNLTLTDKIKKIKAVITDVDGVLTDATMNFFSTPAGKIAEVKKFCAYDGIGFILLRDFGLKTGIITGGNAPATEHRAETLGLDFLYYNYLDKLPALKDLMARCNLKAEEIAYIGDDLIDIPALRYVGLACAVNNAVPEVKSEADYITQVDGGKGAFREVAELILKMQGFWPEALRESEEGTIGSSQKRPLVVIDFKKQNQK